MSGDRKRIVALIGVPLGITVVGFGIMVAVHHADAGASAACAATGGSTQNLSIIVAALGLIGVGVTGSISLIGYLASRQAERLLEQESKEQADRLRLDAAMRAGELLSGKDGEPAAPEVIASGLLALTKLGEE